MNGKSKNRVKKNLITQLSSKRTIHYCNCWFLEANAEIQEEQSDFLTSPIQRDYLGLFQSTQYQAIRLKRRIQIFYNSRIHIPNQIHYWFTNYHKAFVTIHLIIIIKCHLTPDPLPQSFVTFMAVIDALLNSNHDLNESDITNRARVNLDSLCNLFLSCFTHFRW